MAETEPYSQSEARAPGTLPPEVEAELRRRAAGATATTPAGDAAAAPAGSSPTWQQRLKLLGPIAVVAVVLLGKLKFLITFLSQFKFLAVLLKFVLPVVKTGGTMLLSMAVYATAWGWWFALGFVLSILAHEMGHVYAAWRLGIPVSAPIFIPGMGALILQKRATKSAWDGAIIGIGGPVAGTLAGLGCLLAYQITGHPLMLGLAYTGFFLNLFNLAPIFPLDGGWITGAISPRLWLLGLVGMVVAFAVGAVRNPLIFLLVLLSLPRLFHGLKHGDVTPDGGLPTTPRQRATMGVAYLSLCGLLAWLMAHTHVPR